jgi:S1-C subfamily serine protease
MADFVQDSIKIPHGQETLATKLQHEALDLQDNLSLLTEKVGGPGVVAIGAAAVLGLTALVITRGKGLRGAAHIATDAATTVAAPPVAAAGWARSLLGKIASPDMSALKAAMPNASSLKAAIPDMSGLKSAIPKVSSLKSALPDMTSLKSALPDASTLRSAFSDSSAIGQRVKSLFRSADKEPNRVKSEPEVAPTQVQPVIAKPAKVVESLPQALIPHGFQMPTEPAVAEARATTPAALMTKAAKVIAVEAPKPAHSGADIDQAIANIFKPRAVAAPLAEPQALAAPAIVKSRTAETGPLMRDQPAFAIPQVYPMSDQFKLVANRAELIVPKVFNMNQDRILRIDAISAKDGKQYSSTGVLFPSGRIITSRHALQGADGVSNRISAVFPWNPSKQVPLQLETKMPKEMASLRTKLDVDVLLAPDMPEFSRLSQLQFRDQALQRGDFVVGLGIQNQAGGMVASPGIYLGKEKINLPHPNGPEYSAQKSHMIINPGNSGGSLHDAEGTIAGLITQKATDTAYSLSMRDVLKATSIK